MDHHPEPLILNPEPGKHRHTLILLHGTSSSGPRFAPLLLDFPFSLSPPQSPTTSPAFPITNPSPPPFVPKLDPHQRDQKTTLTQELAPGGCLEGIRLVIPTGSLKKLTCLNGKEGNAWFDMDTFSDRTVGEMGQVLGMRESLGYLGGLVGVERRVLERARIGSGGERIGGNGGKGEKGRGKGKLILAGFSQGCAMSMVGVLSGELNVDAFLGMSGWLPFRRQVDEVLSSEHSQLKEPEIERQDPSRKEESGLFQSVVSYLKRFLKIGLWMFGFLAEKVKKNVTSDEEAQKTTGKLSQVTSYYRNLLSLPERGVEMKEDLLIWVGHGKADTKVRYEWGLQMRETIKNVGFKSVETGHYQNLEHWWNEDELRDIVVFLKNVCQ